MKKMIMTLIATLAITIAVVRIWDAVVWDYYRWDYPEWIAYALLCVCAYTGGVLGNALSKIKINFHMLHRKPTYITKELL